MDTLVQLLVQAASVPGRGIMFIDSSSAEDFLSYADVHKAAFRLAGALQERGVVPGDEIVFLVADNKSLLTLFWASLLIKAVPVPLSVGTADEHYIKLSQVWETLTNPLLVHDTGMERLVKVLSASEHKGERLLQIQQKSIPFKELEAVNVIPELPAISGSDLAYIQFSSGSTGTPKGVTLTHDNLVANTTDIMSRSGITTSDRLLSWMPLTHDMGMICAHLTGVRAGIDQYIMPVSLFIRRPLLWLEKAHQHRISLLYSPNFGYQYLLQAMNKQERYNWDLSAVRLIYNGAEPILLGICDEFSASLKKYGLKPTAIYPGYGLAEASVAVTLPDPGDSVKGYFLDRTSLKAGDKVRQAAEADAVTFVEVGKPIDTCRVRIRHEKERDAEDNVIGEIQIQGANVTSGYYHHQQATTAVFTSDGWLKTGDLGFMNNGRLVVTGRIKNIIIINGQNYYPQDIERVVQEIEEIGPGKVVACSLRHVTESRDELLIFLLYKDALPGLLPLIDKVRTKLLNQLGIDAGKIIPVRKIFKTTSGKIQHHKFVEEYEDGTYDALLSEIAALRADDNTDIHEGAAMEDRILPLAQVLFPDHTLLVTDNLFEYGLNSLKANLLVLRLQKALHLRVSLSDLFEYPTVAGLAVAIQANGAPDLLPLPHVDNQALYETAALQKKFWFMQQLPENQGFLHLYNADEMIGTPDKNALTKAFDTIIDRHEILRTTFHMTPDGLLQKIHAAGEVRFALIERDLQLTASKEEALQEEIKWQVQQAFDLAGGPLLRGVLFRMGTDRYVFLFIIHHMVCDGWSIGIFRKEFLSLYDCYHSGLPPELNEVKSQYRDFCAWQQQRRQLPVAEVQKTYWRNVLLAAPPLLRLAGTPAAQPQTYYGRSILFGLPSSLTEKIYTYSHQKNVSLFITLIAALHVLFRKYTGRKDMLFGTDVSGRTHEDLLDNIGLYINTVILRTASDNEDSFEKLTDKVKHTVLGAFEHSEYPFEYLAEEPGIRQQTTSSPLFDVLVLFQNFEHGFSFEHNYADLKISPAKTAVYSSMVDLELEFREKHHSLQLSIRYNSGLFTDGFITTMGNRFVKLLEGMMDAPALPVGQVNMLEEEEAVRMLDMSRGPVVAAPPYACVQQFFEAAAAAFGDRPAIIFEGEQLSYDVLNRQSNRLARYLRQRLNISREDRIGLLLPRNEQMIVALLAVLKSGAAYVPMDPDLPAERIAFMAADANVKAIVVSDAAAYSGKTTNLEIVLLNEGYGNDIEEETRHLPHWNTPGDLAYIMYTSGSTGQPKGVMITHHAMMDYVQTFAAYFSLVPEDNVIQQASLSFDTSIEEIFPAICSGSSVTILKNGGRDIEGIFAAIKDHKATVLSTTPLVINELNKESRRLEGLRVLISGGDELKPSYISHLLDFPALEIYNTYGPTECTICATYGKINDIGDVYSIGRPVVNREVYLLDDRLQPVPAGMSGEIYLGGAGLARGYVNPGEDMLRFIKHPFHANALLFKTGDIGRWQDNGTIQFLGRSDTQVKIRGYRVELAEVETAICRQHNVKDAVVLARENQNGEKFLVAYVIFNQENKPADLLRSLQHILPYYEIPAVVVPMSAFPATANGKIDRNAMPATDNVQMGYDASLAMPLSATEQQLAGIWREVLGGPLPALYDNFFTLGGDSLKAMRLAAGILAVFGVRLEFKDIFLQPVLTEMASLIQDNDQAEEDGILHVPDNDYYEVSAAQQRLWVIDQFEKGYLGSNMTWRLDISGALDKQVLERSLQLITARHESLRTVFVQINGRLVQKILQQVNGLEYRDLSNAPDSEKVILEIMERETKAPFDLEAGPLLRAKLLQRNKEKYVLLLSMHHIISDAWSMKIFIRELLAFYEAGRNNIADPLPPMPLQYRDFTTWKNKADLTAAWQEAKTYWMRQFEKGVPVLELPTDFPRPATKTFNGDSLHFTLTDGQYSSLKQQAHKNDTTLFVTLLSALVTLLHKYTGQQDMVIGTPVDERSHHQLADQIGLYINMLPLRCQIDKEHSFGQLLTAVKEIVVNGLMHRDYSFGRLLEEVPVQYNQGRAPLFDVMMVFLQEEEASGVIDAPDGLLIEKYPVPVSVTQFDLTFIFIQSAEKLSVTIEYNTNLFTAARIKRMGDNFQQLISVVLTGGNTPIRHLSYISLHEQEMLQAFNNTHFRYPEGQTLLTLLTDQVNKTPDAIALVCREQQFSFRELNDAANRLSHYLMQTWSVKAPDIIGIMLDRSEKSVITLLAISKAGACFVNIDHTLPEARVAYIIQDAAPKLLLTEAGLAGKAAGYTGTVIDIDAVDLVGYDTTEPAVPFVPEDLCYIVYTSGSTGNPKGVLQTFRMMFNLTLWDLYGSQLGWGLSLLQYASFSFDASYHDVFFSLSSGGKIFLIPENMRLNFPVLKDYITQQGIEIISFPFSVLSQFFSQVDDNGFEQVKHIISTGEQLLVGAGLKSVLKKYPHIQLHNFYGPSETHVVTAYLADPARPDLMLRPPIGKPVFNSDIHILDVDEQQVPVGVPGEIYIGGDNLAPGYLRLLSMTQERFVNIHVHGREIPVYRSGDIGYWLDDGNIIFTGRKDKQIKIRGHRIEPAETEILLLKHEAVKEAIVLTDKNSQGEYVLLAFYILKQEFRGSDEYNAAALKNYLAVYLPDYMLPSRLVCLDTFPLTPNGKVDTALLIQEQESASVVVVINNEPVSRQQQKLAMIWDEVLRCGPVHPDDNFFDLGGHSLNATAVVTRIHYRLNKKPDLRSVFAYPTIRKLEQHIAHLPEENSPVIPASSVADAYELSFAQQDFWILDRYEKNLTSAHNMSSAYRFGKDFNPELFCRAFIEVVKRHEILRTTFFTKDDQPWQRVHSYAESGIALHPEDWRTHDNVVEDLETLIMQEQLQGFDLEKGPLLSARLLQIADDSFVFIFTIHHIISDQWSTAVLFKDMVTAYDAIERDDAYTLPPLRIHYKDYAGWQNRLFATGDWNKSGDYWLDQFGEDVPVLELLTDFPRPAVKSFSGSMEMLHLDAAHTLALVNIGRRIRSSVFMTLSGVVNALLMRYTGQEDIVLGTPVAGRDHYDLEEQVGYYVNKLAIRTRCSRNDSLKNILLSMREAMLEAFVHQGYPFVKLVADLGLERNPSRSPLFDVMVVMEEADNDLLQLAKFPVEVIAPQTIAAIFDLLFRFVFKNGMVTIVIEYNTDLFKKETIIELKEDLFQLISQLIGNDQVLLSDIRFHADADADVDARAFMQ
ncbi:amino acid adenylation domain-containing protein [Chitinophaga sp. RAB17]|uniref:amino acid adenylation domain-containing protein n=1 Tax=Chitinophaga sp. RAB17 TaxID=3233049 RepID=UPI003F8EC570